MFLYVGKVIVEPDTVFGLLQISSKFDVKALTYGCLEYLIKKLVLVANFNRGFVV